MGRWVLQHCEVPVAPSAWADVLFVLFHEGAVFPAVSSPPACCYPLHATEESTPGSWFSRRGKEDWEATDTPSDCQLYLFWVWVREVLIRNISCLFVIHLLKTIISVERHAEVSPVTRFYQVFRMPHLPSCIAPACVPKLEAEQRTLQFFGTTLLLQSVCRFIEL